jgi:hypothetical protein
MRLWVLALVLAVFACAKKKEEPLKPPIVPKTGTVPGAAAKFDLADVERRLARLVPVELKVDLSTLVPEERQALRHLKAAADAVDRIFWKQVWSRATEVRAEVQKIGGPVAALYDLYYGPWDRTDHHHPFYGAIPRPKGAGFYPEDLTKEELEAYVQAHPAEKTALLSAYTVVFRSGARLRAIPYREAYQADLTIAARELEAAAGLVRAPSLARFLRSRAKAFLTDDYFQSECDWMDVEQSRLDVTIGPYEVYEDDLLGLKTAFEAVVGVRDDAATAALELYRKHLGEIERALPIPDKYRSRRAAGSPLVVINKVFGGGDGNKAILALAFNLPNDEKVRAKKGSRKVMMKNISLAKFEKVLRPIAERLLEPSLRQDVDFETFFNQGLMHELAHGMGPGILKRPEGEVTVSSALKELYSGIEEAKADVVGLFSTQVMLERGLLPKERGRLVYPSYLASMLRSIRFGAQEAHGKANIAQLNFLEAEGGIRLSAETGLFGIDAQKMPGAVTKLAVELLTIEGEGDYARARAFLDRWGKAKPALLEALKKLEGIPVDIAPRYPAL